jgi:hypothetical protein
MTVVDFLTTLHTSANYSQSVDFPDKDPLSWNCVLATMFSGLRLARLMLLWRI